MRQKGMMAGRAPQVDDSAEGHGETSAAQAEVQDETDEGVEDSDEAARCAQLSAYRTAKGRDLLLLRLCCCRAFAGNVISARRRFLARNRGLAAACVAARCPILAVASIVRLRARPRPWHQCTKGAPELISTSRCLPNPHYPFPHASSSHLRGLAPRRIVTQNRLYSPARSAQGVGRRRQKGSGRPDRLGQPLAPTRLGRAHQLQQGQGAANGGHHRPAKMMKKRALRPRRRRGPKQGHALWSAVKLEKGGGDLKIIRTRDEDDSL